MHTWFRYVVVVVLGGLQLVAAPSWAKQAFTIRVGPGHNDFPLAIPHAQVGVSLQAQATELLDMVRRDLALTGYFKLLSPQRTPDRGGIVPGSFLFDDWRVFGASALVKTGVSAKPDGRIQVDAYLYDVSTGQKLTGLRFLSQPTAIRPLAHRLASAILEALTGQQGFFDAQIGVVSDQTGNKEIYLMGLDGTNLRPVTRNGSINLSPAIHPKGSEIAWTSFKHNHPRLYAKQLRTGAVRTVSKGAGLHLSPAYSPDGKHIALTRSFGGDSDIVIVDAQTGAMVQRVTQGGGIDIAPSYSPDGTQLVYASERSGGSHIFIHHLATGQVRRISFQGAFNNDPVWSPDGTRIAYVGRNGQFDIFVYTLATGQTVRVTEHQGNNEDPCWSPNSQYLLFSSTRDSNSAIWLSTWDGRHQAPITPGQGGLSQPIWAVGG